MSATLSFVAALSLCCAGMSGLALAKDRHYQQIHGTRKVPPRRRRLARSGGWVLLGLALLSTIETWGIGIGVVTWCATLTAGAMLVIGLLPYAPRALARIAAASAGVGVMLVLWQFLLSVLDR